MRNFKYNRLLNWFLLLSFTLLIILTFYMVGKQLTHYIKNYNPITSIYINSSGEIFISIRYHLKSYLFKSKDRGESWENITPDFFLKDNDQVNDILFIFGKKEMPGFVGLVSKDSFFISHDFGITWERNKYPDDIRVYLARQNPFSENEIMLASFTGIFFTSNYGKDLSNITNVFNKETESSSFIIKDLKFSKTPGILYFASYDSLFNSQNGGLTWKKISTSRKYYYQIEIDPENPGHIYAGISNGGILESFNGGYSWEYLDKRLPIKAKENLRCFFLRVSPFDKNLIFGSIEADDKIKTNLFSKDAGKSWKKMNLKDNLDSGSIMLFTEDLIYLGNSTGNLFISKDSGENWEKLKFNIEGLVK